MTAPLSPADSHAPPARPLEHYIYRWTVAAKRLHEAGECAGINCPWCDHAKQVEEAQ